MPFRNTSCSTAIVLAVTAMSPTLSNAEQSYPITIEHALGTTVIDAKPVRVATVTWGNHEVPLALGVVPVGMAFMSWGDDNGDGIHPWVETKLNELGAEVPTLFNEGDGIDFEAVAASNPDVILAAYSGLSQEDYDTLSQIAPVVAYPTSRWTTDWRTTIQMNSTAMGMAEEGDALIERLEAKISEVAGNYPQLNGQKAMLVSHTDASDLSVVRFYSGNDPRVQFFKELGMELSNAVAATVGDDTFRGEFSAEQIDTFDDVTLVVTYAGSEMLDAMQDDPLVSKMPAVANGAFALLNNSPLGAAANPTALVLEYALDDYVSVLAAAADKAK
ncbi:iron complex transport system substrate-binding protein [Aliiroseovarius halocynthiae]|uniref:Iron-siderophore ABC transporter substrate-binding protein n=2 Tax=Aliiroseovarius halocynthiae TaxID=985055 RepID=A0A545SNK0_9RHOB|nr:iron-siderophore ABC transporter substrate-binding protein [Aliiroseovarius halocynthiae]SMR82597.1 iron complex transport system substrate-binding protein [Aliiroseovarius halocynthiae]